MFASRRHPPTRYLVHIRVPVRGVTVGIAALAAVVLAAVIPAARRSSGDHHVAVPAMAPAPAAVATSGATATDRAIDQLQARLAAGRPDAAAYADLGHVYLQKVREVADPTYYARAEAALRRSLELAPENDGALNGLGALALARHQFAEALDWGQRAVRANPSRAANYGVVGDALVELGRYDEAVAAVQKMVDTRPDLSSYARVSYLRELHGDPEGAIAAMMRAVGAGGPAAENVAYVRVLLGNLYAAGGRIDAADAQYQAALARLPEYGPALAGHASVLAARGADDEAIALLSRAVARYPAPEYVITLGDLETRAGRTTDAAAHYDLVRAIERLYAANGTDVDVETALFEADHGPDPAAAVTLARAGYAARPNIHAADALAWALYRAGSVDEARARSAEALRLGTRDALMLFHAGMIAHAAGDDVSARDRLEQALAINPAFSVLHADEARRTLTALGSPATSPTMPPRRG